MSVFNLIRNLFNEREPKHTRIYRTIHNVDIYKTKHKRKNYKFFIQKNDGDIYVGFEDIESLDNMGYFDSLALFNQIKNALQTYHYDTIMIIPHSKSVQGILM